MVLIFCVGSRWRVCRTFLLDLLVTLTRLVHSTGCNSFWHHVVLHGLPLLAWSSSSSLLFVGVLFGSSFLVPAMARQRHPNTPLNFSHLKRLPSSL